MELQEIINDRNIGIHCRTEEQARVLLSKLNALELCWRGGGEYDISDTYWYEYREHTYYKPSEGTFGWTERDHGNIIIEFEDVEFD